jgi:hypothetical protein
VSGITKLPIAEKHSEVVHIAVELVGRIGRAGAFLAWKRCPYALDQRPWARSSAVEHSTFNRVVDGSNPSGLTTTTFSFGSASPRSCPGYGGLRDGGRMARRAVTPATWRAPLAHAAQDGVAVRNSTFPNNPVRSVTSRTLRLRSAGPSCGYG